MMSYQVMDGAELSDADLVAQSLSGNRDAFGQVVQRYQTLVTSVAYSATGNVTQSEDLAQETFVTAWKQLAQLREPAKLRPWLCSITRFLIGKEFRRQGREPLHDAQSLDTLEDWTSPEPLPREHAISQEELSLLWRSLERIPPAYREPLVLFYREHQSIEAVARGLGLSEDVVKQRLSRGRKFLQEQFIAFVAGALDQTRPGKTFALGVLAALPALPLLSATAKGAAVGATLATHGSVAVKTTSSGGVLHAISSAFMGMIYWLATALPLGGYIGYKMGGDSRTSEQARRSVATFWHVMGISMFLVFCLPPLLATLFNASLITKAKGLALFSFWVHVPLPIFLLGVVPLCLLVWIWQRRRQPVAEEIISAPSPSKLPKSAVFCVVLSMTLASLYLAVLCWSYIQLAHIQMPQFRSLSTTQIQNFIASNKVRETRFTLIQNANGLRALRGELQENGIRSVLVAPAENSTLALLSEKGITFETVLENRDIVYGGLGQWLLCPFCIFVVVTGATTLLRARHQRPSEASPLPGPPNERPVDRAFAAFAACAMVALAVWLGATTDWHLRKITAGQISEVIAQYPKAKFEVFYYNDGSKRLWISDHRTPDFIAPADESTLGLLKRQGITYETYIVGASGDLPKRSQTSALLLIIVLTAAAGTLIWWLLKARLGSPTHILPLRETGPR